MRDVQTQLEKLRKEAAECRVLSSLSADPEKKKMFASVADHITGLASAVQNEMAIEPVTVVHEAKMPATGQKPSVRFGQILPWFVVIILLATMGGLFLLRADKAAPSVAALETKAEPQRVSQEDTNQTRTNFMLAEEEKRKALSDQLGALTARVDNLEQARAEIPEPATKRDEPIARRDESIRRKRYPRYRSVGLFGEPRY